MVKILIITETYSEPSRTSKMDFFAKEFKGLKRFQKIYIFDVRLGSEYASASLLTNQECCKLSKLKEMYSKLTHA